MNAGIVLVVSLHLHPGHEATFREFETCAAQIMARHGGRIDRVIRPVESLPDEPLPYEIHLVSFPSLDHFQSYRSDSALAALQTLRQAAIAKTSIVIGRESQPYAS